MNTRIQFGLEWFTYFACIFTLFTRHIFTFIFRDKTVIESVVDFIQDVVPVSKYLFLHDTLNSYKYIK